MVFVRTDRLGETVLTLPAIDALRAARPQGHLRLMVHPSVRELFDGYPHVDEVVAEPPAAGLVGRAWSLSRLWRRWDVDVIIISNAKKEYHLAAWLAGIPVRVGYDRKWGRLLTHRIPDERPLGEQHEVEYNIALLASLGISSALPPLLRLPVEETRARHMAQQLEGWRVQQADRLIAIHPWTSNPRKQWPLNRFHALARELGDQPDIRLLLIGGEAERAQMAGWPADAGPREGRVIDAVGRLSLPELAACLQRVRVLVTNDSGPMHVAAAVGTPVVALFGTGDPGSHPRRWGPWGSGHTVIHKPLEQITVDEVLGAVRRYL